ncbi:MAG: hypothetical protein QM535_13430 [Limnohabitans sp.]|nr:hypothetical protein [Limnohabitans sp.]
MAFFKLHKYNRNICILIRLQVIYLAYEKNIGNIAIIGLRLRANGTFGIFKQRQAQALAVILFDCYGAGGILLNDSTKLQQPTPLCSTFARQKPRTSLAKELQNLRFLLA